MTKKIYAIAIMAMTFMSATTFAQNTNNNRGCLEATCSKPAPGVKHYCPEATPAIRPDAPKANLFKGIQLTAAQKTKIERLEAKNRQERDKQHEKARKEREKKMEKRDKEMKKILTPAQYEQYKANVKAMKDGKRGAKANKRHDGKHRKHECGNTGHCKQEAKSHECTPSHCCDKPCAER